MEIGEGAQKALSSFASEIAQSPDCPCEEMKAQKALSSFASEMVTMCRFSTLVAHLKGLL